MYQNSNFVRYFDRDSDLKIPDHRLRTLDHPGTRSAAAVEFRPEHPISNQFRLEMASPDRSATTEPVVTVSVTSLVVQLPLSHASPTILAL